MLLHKLKSTIFALLALAAVATGAGYLTHSLAMKDEPRQQPAAPHPQIVAKPDDTIPRPVPGRMFVVGRVLDPQGKPVPGATVMVHARSLVYALPYISLPGSNPIGDARADGSGRFRLDAPRTSSSSHARFGAVALAPGYGVGWVELDPDDDQPNADITLRPEQVIHGRLFDVQGQPVPGVTLSVWSIRRNLPQALAGARSRNDGVVFLGTTVKNFPAWPRPVTTDPEGRFTLRGVGRDLDGSLNAHHPRFALQRIPFDTKGASESKRMTAALVPAQVLTGRVTYADTGQPVPHAALLAGSNAQFEADAEGRFRLNLPLAKGGYNVWAYPPVGQPYLTVYKRIDWPKGAVEQPLDLALPRGISIRGKVTEAGSGTPVPEATVTYFSRGWRPDTRESVSISLKTAADGSFLLGTPPKPGCLFIKGPSDDYVFQAIGDRMFEDGQPGGHRAYSHAHTVLDPKPGSGDREVNFVLRRGVTVKGQVVGPDGQPIREARIFSRIILDPRVEAWRSWDGEYPGTVRNGRFEVHGLDPDAEVPAYFLDAKGKLGVVVNFSGKSAAGGPVTVRLEPCGVARARVVDPAGRPVAGRLSRGQGAIVFREIVTLAMIVTPGPPFSRANAQLAADSGTLSTLDPVNYDRVLISDVEGRITLPVLIPGATYRVIDRSTPPEVNPQVRKEFTVKPGEALDLGDIVIAKPQS